VGSSPIVSSWTLGARSGAHRATPERASSSGDVSGSCFFDWGSGVCLWGASDLTTETFGYAIDHRDIGLPVHLVEEVDHLITWHLGCLDPNDPGGPSPWSPSQREDFHRAAAVLVTNLRLALGPQWEIIDETRTE